MAVYLMGFALFLIGVFGVLSRKNLIKMILGVLIADYAVNLLIVLVGYRQENPGVDPAAQAMVLLTIMLGLSLLLLLTALCARIYEKNRTLDITQINNLKEK